MFKLWAGKDGSAYAAPLPTYLRGSGLHMSVHPKRGSQVFPHIHLKSDKYLVHEDIMLEGITSPEVEHNLAQLIRLPAPGPALVSHISIGSLKNSIITFQSNRTYVDISHIIKHATIVYIESTDYLRPYLDYLKSSSKGQTGDLIQIFRLDGSEISMMTLAANNPKATTGPLRVQHDLGATVMTMKTDMEDIRKMPFANRFIEPIEKAVNKLTAGGYLPATVNDNWFGGVNTLKIYEFNPK